MKDTRAGSENIQVINPWRLFTGAIVPNWLLERSEVSPGAKICYARLCQHAGKKGHCWPKQRTLATELGVDARQVRRYLSELESHALIKAFKVGFQGQNSYQFLAHTWMEIEDSKRTDMSSLEGGSKRTDVSSLKRTDMSSLDRTDVSALSIEENQKARESKSKRITAPEKFNHFFSNIDPDWRRSLQAAFPDIDLDREFKKMHAWLLSNPEKQKKNLKRFANSWLRYAKPAGVDTLVDEGYLNEKLGRIATKTMIIAVLKETPVELWERVAEFLRGRYPGSGERAFAEARRDALAEGEAGRGRLQEITAGIGG